MATPYIVVGVDGSPGGRRALDWALGEAVRRNAEVRAVTAWTWDGLESPLAIASPQDARVRAERELDRQVEEAFAARPAEQPSVTRTVVEGGAAEVLTRAARDAEFLVVGSHGHRAIHSLVMGSVSTACIRHATCPVVVLPVPHIPESRHGVRRAGGVEATRDTGAEATR